MNDYTNDEIIFITDSTMCSSSNLPCPIRDSDGNADYLYYINGKGVKDVDWKIATGTSDTDCEKNWAYLNSDGSINTANVPYTITDSNGTWCKKKIKYSKNQLMKAWNNAGCVSDFPVTANTTGWQNLNSLADVQTNMNTNWKNSKDINYLKQCYGFDFIKAGNIPLTSGILLTSPKGTYIFTLLGNGSAYVSKPGSPAIWQTSILPPDSSMVGGKLILQTDGNLVLYRTDGSAYWSSGTGGSVNSGINNILIMQDDGNLCIYDTSNNSFILRWKSSTLPITNPVSSGQVYNILKNTTIKNIKNNSYPKMSNDTFDPNNKLNSEDALFFTLLNKNIYYCNNKDVKDPYCSTFYNNANNKINSIFANNYLLKK